MIKLFMLQCVEPDSKGGGAGIFWSLEELLEVLTKEMKDFLFDTVVVFVKSFPVKTSLVSFDLEGPIEVQRWDKPYIRILTTVSLGNGNSEVLRSLMVLGRYRVDMTNVNENQLFTSSSRKREITYHGIPLKERVQYTVFVPLYTEVRGLGDDELVAKGR